MTEQRTNQVMILRRKQVEQRTGLSRSTIYLRVSQGNFPKAASLGAGGWSPRSKSGSPVVSN